MAIESMPSSTSSFITHVPLTPFSSNERRSSGTSSQPQRAAGR